MLVARNVALPRTELCLIDYITSFICSTLTPFITFVMIYLHLVLIGYDVADHMFYYILNIVETMQFIQLLII